MFFYVDESGHTGLNLFDETQPFLYYGVLSSKTNLDVLATSKVKELRQKLGVERLHAAELGNGRLIEIIKDINTLKEKYDLRFDFYTVTKADHALICFFDQVFDQGLNPAVPWSAYWTPLKYVFLIKLYYLFDDELLKQAWKARITVNNTQAENILKEVCQKVIERVHYLPDARSREVITDAMRWVINNPSKISYNASSKEHARRISANLIGFQAVMFGIAERLKKQNNKAIKIIVDQQSEFNRGQKFIADFYDKVRRNEPWILGAGLPVMDLKYMPTVPISCTSGKESIGLELADIFIWIFKRKFEGKELAPELHSFIKSQLYRMQYEEVSIKALEKRWGKWFSELPKPTEEQLTKGKEIMDAQEKFRLAHVVS